MLADIDIGATSVKYSLPELKTGCFFAEMAMHTYSAKPEHIDKKWILVDAEDMVLGRLASFIAVRLRGKNKVMFTPHMDTGDNVIVINADKVKLTGRKRKNKRYYWHTGYPGGIRFRTAEQVLDGKHPERVIQNAVRRMLPSNKLSRKLMRNLRVYTGPAHNHEAQNPEKIDFASINEKNSRSNSK